MIIKTEIIIINRIVGMQTSILLKAIGDITNLEETEIIIITEEILRITNNVDTRIKVIKANRKRYIAMNGKICRKTQHDSE